MTFNTQLQLSNGRVLVLHIQVQTELPLAQRRRYFRQFGAALRRRGFLMTRSDGYCLVFALNQQPVRSMCHQVVTWFVDQVESQELTLILCLPLKVLVASPRLPASPDAIPELDNEETSFIELLGCMARGLCLLALCDMNRRNAERVQREAHHG